MYKPMEQIEKEYDGQWVFMINYTENKHGTLLGGEIVLHSESRSKVVRNMVEADEGDSLTFIGYVGKAPKGGRVSVMGKHMLEMHLLGNNPSIQANFWDKGKQKFRKGLFTYDTGASVTTTCLCSYLPGRKFNYRRNRS